MDLENKICVLTGSTSGIGRPTALALAAKGIQLVLPVRNMQKGRMLKNEILQKTGNKQVHLYICDLSSMDSIRNFCDTFRDRYRHLHILINNAGLWENRRRESQDGIELTFAVNHLAPFLMTHLLLPLIKKSSPARIINVSSIAHMAGRIHLSNPELKGIWRPWTGFRAYAQSKLANIHFTRKLAGMIKDREVSVNSLHPGVVDTGLYAQMPSFFKPLARRLFASAEKGAQTLIYLALDPAVGKLTGQYFVGQKPRRIAPHALDESVAESLWQLSCDYAGLEKTFDYGKTG